jgi:hypothetical protein
MVVSSLAYSFTLKMEVTCSSETSVDFNGLLFHQKEKTYLIITLSKDTGEKTSQYKLIHELQVWGLWKMLFSEDRVPYTHFYSLGRM